MRRRDPSIMFLLVIVVVVSVGFGITWLVTGNDKEVARRDECPEGDLTGREVLECTAPSVAYIKTPLGSGSGVLIEDGYVVTNAHVIDPFDQATVTFTGGDVHKHVPLVGVDLFADIAVLGPIETARPGRSLTRPTSLQPGDPVFLVGYPGETEDQPDATISQGVFSRSRHDDNFDLTFLQTDATIAGGQSGGAFIDDRGTVIGISGYSFAEGFALALDGGDAQRVVEKVRAGKGSQYVALPAEGRTDNTVIRVMDSEHPRAVIIPPSDAARTVQIDTYVTSDIPIVAFDLDGEPLAINQAALRRGLFFAERGSFAPEAPLEADLFPPSDASTITESDQSSFDSEMSSFAADFGFPPVDKSVPAGSIRFDLEPDKLAVVVVGYVPHDPVTDVGIQSSEKFFVVPEEQSPRAIAVGDTKDAVLDSFKTSGDLYEIDLAEGETIDIRVTSPTHDMAYTVLAPGQDRHEGTEVDDSGEGIGGFDPHDTFTARRAGLYTIVVHSYEGLSAGYRIAVASA